MRITTWNVNSIRVRMDHLLSWLAFTSPDIVALQETKCEDDKFPAAALEEIGYHSIFFGQKSYNGVALLSRQPLTRYFIEGYLGDHDQRRVIAAEYQDCLIVNVYVPNGQAVGSEKYAFKLVWLKALAELLNTLKKKFSKIIILGDFNIAPETIDHTSANFIKDDIMTSVAERQAFHELLAMGFHDSFRLFNKEPKQYTWWDYRIRAFEKNLGYRIDHILVSDTVLPQCTACDIDKSLRALEKPSDHAPVTLTVAI